SEPVSPFARAVAGDAQVHRSFENSGQFQAVIKRPPLTLVLLGRLAIGLQKAFINRAARGFFADHDEIPRLHQAYRGAMMGGVEQPAQYPGRHWRRQELRTDIAP